jgi:hypothetical protein
MRPLFTIHAGEYLLGSHIEHSFPELNVWVPTRDTGVDLLVSDHNNRRAVSLQAKFSKDYLPTQGHEFQEPLRFCGFCMINRDKLRHSQADFWVFVLRGFKKNTTDFVIVPPQELGERLTLIHGLQSEKIKIYPWVTERDECWETRGLKDEDELRIARYQYENPLRDFKKWLNNWTPVMEPLGPEMVTKARNARAAAGHS